MFSLGYTAVVRRWTIAPSLVAGAALNALRIDQTLDPAIAVTGTGSRRRLGTRWSADGFVLNAGLVVTLF